MVQSLGHGGCERDAAKIAIGLDSSRFEPHVGIFREGGFRVSEVLAAGVPVVRFPVTSFSNLSLVRAAQEFGAYVRQHGIQLVHAFDVPTDLFTAPAARYYKVRHVITSQLSFRSMYEFRERVLLRLSDRLSCTVVVNSRAVGDSLTQEYGIRPEKIFLSYNGVNTREFHPGHVPRPEWLKDASVVVGSVCVMRPEKRIDWVIRSFAEARRFDDKARLVLIGSGPEVPRLTALRDELGLTEVCFFVPGQAEVADWMRLLDVYINSSSIESFPNGLLEAMACGCCVIGSNVGGIPELVAHQQNGLIFDSRNPQNLTEMLSLAICETSLRQQMRQNAAKTASTGFTMRMALDRHEALYTRLLERPVQS